MLDPQPHVIAISVLAIIAAGVCHLAGHRLRIAGFALAASFGIILVGQLAFSMKAPGLTVLTAVCDMVTLGVIGWALLNAWQRAGLHVAGMAMCVSLMSHVAYHVIGIGHSATLTYYVATNACMVMACLGLIWSGLNTLVARHGIASGSDPDSSGLHSWGYRVAKRHKAGL